MANSIVHSAMIRGLEAVPVDVECSIETEGLPGISIIGMSDAAILEARYRIRCALKQAGFEIPRAHITINLSPSNLHKNGDQFDLAIALAILGATQQISTERLDDVLAVGPLSLYGNIVPSRGALAYGDLALEKGLVLVSGQTDIQWALQDSELECDNLDKLETLKELEEPLGSSSVALLHPAGVIEDYYEGYFRDFENSYTPDYADVVGMEGNKVALMVAAIGGHNVLIQGSEGSGKDMLASRFNTILPKLTEEERHSALLAIDVCEPISDELSDDAGPIVIEGTKPSIKVESFDTIGEIVGGGRPVKPGKAALANNGILYLNHIEKFSITQLTALRQCLSDGEINIVRVDGKYKFPSHTQIIATASNPFEIFDDERYCEHYQQHFAGPIKDKFDICLATTRPAPEQFANVKPDDLDSVKMRELVAAGIAFKEKREKTSPEEMKLSNLKEFGFSDDAVKHFWNCVENYDLSGSRALSVARVARSYADYKQDQIVSHEDVEYASNLSHQANLESMRMAAIVEKTDREHDIKPGAIENAEVIGEALSEVPDIPPVRDNTER